MSALENVPQQSNQTDTTDNSVSTVTVSAEEYALIEEFKRDRRERAIETRLKNHSKNVPARRNTIALRRINLKEVAPDRDVLAYIEVCNLKAVAGQKAEATEEEMKAYLQLFDQGVDFPILEAVLANIGN